MEALAIPLKSSLFSISKIIAGGFIYLFIMLNNN